MIFKEGKIITNQKLILVHSFGGIHIVVELHFRPCFLFSFFAIVSFKILCGILDDCVCSPISKFHIFHKNVESVKRAFAAKS